jgi:site-specific recombinase XerD
MLTPELFKRDFPHILDTHHNFITWYEERLKQRFDTGVIEKNTHKGEQSTIRKLKEFRTPIYFTDLNKKLLQDFHIYCRDKKKNKRNTIWGHFKHINSYVIAAIDLRLMQNNPCDEYWVSDETGSITALDQLELEKLIKYYNSAGILPNHRDVLQWFLYACFTGPRKSDINAMSAENIVGDFLVYLPKKTSRVKSALVSVPLRPGVLAFLESTEGKLFKNVVTDQSGNRILKKIAKACNISTHITTHVARHTFATIFLELGGKVEVLQQLMGHSRIQTTMRYVHINKKRKLEQMSVFDAFLVKASLPASSPQVLEPDQ